MYYYKYSTTTISRMPYEQKYVFSAMMYEFGDVTINWSQQTIAIV